MRSRERTFILSSFSPSPPPPPPPVPAPLALALGAGMLIVNVVSIRGGVTKPCGVVELERCPSQKWIVTGNTDHIPNTSTFALFGIMRRLSSQLLDSPYKFKTHGLVSPQVLAEPDLQVSIICLIRGARKRTRINHGEHVPSKHWREHTQFLPLIHDS